MSARLVYLWERPGDARLKAVDPARKVPAGTVWAVQPLGPDKVPGRTMADRARATLELARRETSKLDREQAGRVEDARDCVHQHSDVETRAGLEGAEIRWADETPEEAGE